MKITPRFKIPTFILAASLSVGTGFVSPATAQDHSYLVDLNSKKITDLGSLGEGSTYAHAINDAGQVVGYSSPHTVVIALDGAGRTDLGTHAFITGPNGSGMTDLGTLGGNFSAATGINDAGQVAGWSYTAKPNTYHAFITGANGAGMTDLGTLGGNFSIATSINAAGEVAGFSSTTAGSTHAFITGPDGVGMTDLGTLGGDESRAYGINNAGQVVGFSDTANGFANAFITGAGGVGMTSISAGDLSNAYGINDAGQVVGDVHRGGGYYAFITGPNGMGMTDLVTGQAHAVNSAGEGAGISGDRTFITGPNGVGRIDLNSFVARSDGFILTNATGINNNGQVIAIGVAGIVPEPGSYALMLAGLALVGFMARGKQKV